MGQDIFRPLVCYCVGEAPSLLARAYKAKAKPGTPKYKFGIQVPMGIKQALRLDKINGNTLWQDAIAKELQGNFLTSYKTFRLPEPGEDLTEY